jgi:Tol biopolymer transport system component
VGASFREDPARSSHRAVVGAVVLFLVSGVVLVIGMLLVSIESDLSGDPWSVGQVVGVAFVGWLPFLIGVLVLLEGGAIGARGGVAVGAAAAVVTIVVGVAVVGSGGDEAWSYRTVSSPVWSPDGTKIAFVRTTWTPHKERGEDRTWTPAGAIVVMDADGGRMSELTPLEKLGDDAAPVWSPDGRRIAYVTEQRPTADIAVVDATSGASTIVAGTPLAEREPAWSPDGRQIAYTAGNGDAADVFVIAADGSSERQLTRNAGRDGNPSWSPDGRRIAFDSDRTGATRVWVMDADGANQHELTAHRFLFENTSSSPLWSPDGRAITFDSSSGVAMTGAVGTNLRQLTSGAEAGEYDETRGWSPDGRTILIERGTGHWLNGNVVAASTDGGTTRYLTRSCHPALGPPRPCSGDDVWFHEPAWSPTGPWIAYVRDGLVKSDIWLMRPDGTGKRNITRMENDYIGYEPPR